MKISLFIFSLYKFNFILEMSVIAHSTRFNAFNPYLSSPYGSYTLHL